MKKKMIVTGVAAIALVAALQTSSVFAAAPAKETPSVYTAAPAKKTPSVYTTAPAEKKVLTIQTLAQYVTIAAATALLSMKTAMVSVITTGNLAPMGPMLEKALSMKTAMVSVITMLPEGRMEPAAGAGEAATATETTVLAATVTEEAVTGDNNGDTYAE